MARIVVAGYVIRHPLAGNLFAFLHHVLGLECLGHEVFYLEESGWPDSCYDPTTRSYGEDPGAGLRAVRALLAAHGGTVPVSYIHRETGRIEGAEWEDVKRRLAQADLLLNIGGVCWLPEFRLCRRRALIDKDPLFTQVGRFGGALLDEHDVHFSYGVNIGRPCCNIPSAGVDWLPTVPPVAPELWEPRETRPGAPFTTIASLDAYGAVTYQGERYGQKDEEFLRFIDLPGRTSHPLELAVKGSREVRERLLAAGWLVRSPGEISSDPAMYHEYITGSRGEVSVAKNAYVKSHSGWFSDRSVCYLAAGLPVILQDTDFHEWLPEMPGVLAFSSLDEAAACIERVNADYETHRRGAREAAESVFSYRKVLPALVDAALGSGTAPRP